MDFGWMVDLAMSIFECLTKFLILWHPWHPWGCIHSVCWKRNLKQIEAIPPSVKCYSRGIKFRLINLSASWVQQDLFMKTSSGDIGWVLLDLRMAKKQSWEQYQDRRMAPWADARELEIILDQSYTANVSPIKSVVNPRVTRGTP